MSEAPPPTSVGSAPMDPTKRMKGSGTKEDPWEYQDEFGIAYIWDNELQVWKSKEDLDALIAKQQQAYSSDQHIEHTDQSKQEDEKKKRKKDKKKKKKDNTNSAAYVTGLPPDITESRFIEFMSKCGVPKKDPIDPTKIKCKVYRDEQGKAKGDGLFIYFKPESVDLALQILDGTEIVPGAIVKVQPAVFDQKEDKDGKPKKRSKKLKVYKQEQELGWEENENKHVVLKHMFDPKEALDNLNYYQEIEEDVRIECEKLGEVQKVKVFQRNPEGVVVVIFEDSLAAKKCVEKMNGRWFAGQQIIAEFYDGFTNYTVEEHLDPDEEKKRLDEFGDWLEKD